MGRIEDAIEIMAIRLNSNPNQTLNTVVNIIKKLKCHINRQQVLSCDERYDLVDQLSYYVYVQPICLPLKQKIGFTRAVRYSETSGCTYSNVSRLSYIPIGSEIPVSKGRINESGESLFYASLLSNNNSVLTALAECRSSEGETFNILFSETCPNTYGYLTLQPLGLNDYFRRGVPDPFYTDTKDRELYKKFLSAICPEGKIAMQLCDAFMVDVLTSPGSDTLYDVSSAIGKKYLSAPFDGLIYPSTKYAGHPNVALKPSSVDQKLQHISTQSVLVDEKYDYGIYQLSQRAKGKVDSVGAIVWDAVKS
ncbi:hypothetical protein [Psychromonas aquimarina]|uniref:hypothetical protein n=1 Tax=Psychromonas aquimarina TaxID=444919 RepID=UPI0003FF5DA4|nr:hypothetical protein [Psychromonas aquimarina]